MKQVLLLIICSCNLYSLTGQDIIKLENRSFEEMGLVSTMLAEWYNCGRNQFPDERPLVVFPNRGFRMEEQAQQGSQFLGLVVRNNNTWGSVSQQLEHSLLLNEY